LRERNRARSAGLVDHFDFLDRMKSKAKGARLKPPASKPQGALDVGWFLSTTDKWVDPYYDPGDLRSVDRQLFARQSFDHKSMIQMSPLISASTSSI
jgi:hypothetical protein